MSDPALRDAFQVLERAERAAQATLADRFQAIKQALTAVWGAEAVRGIIPLRPNCPRIRVFVDNEHSLLVELDGPAGAASPAPRAQSPSAQEGPALTASLSRRTATP